MIDTATNSATVASAHVRVGKQQARPNALIVGPMKAGTSWLYEYLASRDDVVVPSGTKETFYFDERFESKSLAWYLSHFQHVKYTTGKRIIEVAPTYFHPAKVPSRVRETLGEIKIVVTLRDPAERAFSLFQHMRRYGFTSCSEFQDAVVKHPEIIESSLYNESLVRWEQAFGRENVTVLFMEDLKSSPINFAGKCCRALGLAEPTSEEALPQKVNVAADPRNYHVAKFGRVAGDLLRSFRLYPIVQAAKKVGLKRVVFGKPQTVRQIITAEERAWFLEQIKLDVVALQNHVDRDLDAWLNNI